MSDAAGEAAAPRPLAGPTSGTGPASARVLVAVTACTALALALGLYDLQRRSLWQDEGFTWGTVDQGFPALLSVLARHEGYQILHALIEWPTNRISSTLAALRMPSVLSFAAAVPAVWLTGRRLFDDRVGMIAALLFAINGSVLSYAQEARSYMLATMLAAYAGAMLAGYVLAPGRWSRAAWITFSVLTIYAHGFAVLAIAAQIFALWFLPAERRRALHWLRDGTLIALLASPAILAPVYQINSGEISFIKRPGLHALAVFAWFVSGRTYTAVLPYAVGIVAGLVAAVTVWRRSLHSVEAFRYALLFLWAVMPAFIVMSVSYVRPIWIDRYALWSSGALVVLVAYGLTRLASGRVLAVLVLVTALLGARGVVNWYRAPAYEDYHAAMGELTPRLRAGDALIFSPDEVRIPAEFYLRHVTKRLDLVPLFPTDPWGTFKTGEQHVVPFDEHTIAIARPARYPRIWLVAFDVTTTLNTRMAQMSRRYRIADARIYQGGIEVLLLEARPGAT